MERVLLVQGLSGGWIFQILKSMLLITKRACVKFRKKTVGLNAVS
jgi:hypothetical protein